MSPDALTWTHWAVTSLVGALCVVLLKYVTTLRELVEEKTRAVKADADRADAKAEKARDLAVTNMEKIHDGERRLDGAMHDIKTLFTQSASFARADIIAMRLDSQDKQLEVCQDGIEWVSERLGRKASRSEMAAVQSPPPERKSIPRVDPDSDRPIPPPRPKFPSRNRLGGAE